MIRFLAIALLAFSGPLFATEPVIVCDECPVAPQQPNPKGKFDLTLEEILSIIGTNAEDEDENEGIIGGGK